METKHTPGQWEFLEDGRTDSESNACRPLTISSAAPHHDTIANVYSRDDTTVSISREEAIANALLIAVAPKLLALLIESQENIGGDWRERRDAVIAKATGAA